MVAVGRHSAGGLAGPAGLGPQAGGMRQRQGPTVRGAREVVFLPEGGRWATHAGDDATDCLPLKKGEIGRAPCQGGDGEVRTGVVVGHGPDPGTGLVPRGPAGHRGHDRSHERHRSHPIVNGQIRLVGKHHGGHSPLLQCPAHGGKTVRPVHGRRVELRVGGFTEEGFPGPFDPVAGDYSFGASPPTMSKSILSTACQVMALCIPE